MRTVFRLALALCLASALHSDERPPLDLQFHEAVERGDVSVQEMLQRLSAATRSGGTPAAVDSFEFPTIYAMAIKRATSAELDELGELLRGMPAEFLYFDECFSSYATARIRQRVAQLKKDPVRLEWEPTKEAVPKELAEAPAGFQDAWKLYRTVTAPYLAAVPPWETAELPRSKLPPLEMELRKVIGTPRREAWKSLAAHIWGGWCGTGSDSLYHPRNRALLLSFLADGMLRESAGAALLQAHSISSVSDQEAFEDVLNDLLTGLGVDWEQVMLGSVLPVSGYNAVNLKPVITSRLTECDAWRLLAACGSEHAVRQCLDLIRWARLDPRNAAEFLAVALGPEHSRPEVIPVFSTDHRPVRRTPLPERSRMEVLSVFAGYLASTNHPVDLIEAMEEIPWDCAAELQAPLAALVAHPVHAVSARAYQLLKEAGLATGQEKVAAALPPLTFRILLNGKPLRSVKVSVDAIAKPKPGGEKQFYTRAVAPSQDLTTDGNGVIRYSLDECLEPERVAAIRIRMGPPSSSSEREDDIMSPLREQAEKPLENDWPGPWIVHQVAVVAGDERMHDIDLRTADLEIEVAAFDGFAAETPVKIMLRRAYPREPFSPEAGVAKAAVKLGKTAHFRQLQSGKYALAVTAPGAARYESGDFTVGDGALTQKVKLEPGRDARGIAVFPNELKTSLVSSARLFRDGVEVPRVDPDEWKGLRFGKYIAHIPSTHEWEEEDKKLGIPPTRFAREDRVEACDLRFVIDSSTPPTLDLGEVIISPERR